MGIKWILLSLGIGKVSNAYSEGMMKATVKLSLPVTVTGVVMAIFRD
jgi:hypothetical protein